MSEDHHMLTSTPSPPLLSPPDSQHHYHQTEQAMPTAASGSALANSNGKRPHGTISNGEDSNTNIMTSNESGGVVNPSNGVRRGEFAPKIHAASGYTWDRAEDEPGYAWLSKKSTDEFQRAVEGLVHVGAMVRGTYGDPVEVAERERARMVGAN